jgi:5-formyltetrahydrofolate cyclo-ligase
MITKAELRRSIRERLARLTAHERAEKSRLIREAIVRQRRWRHAAMVCLFAPHGMEPEIDPLWETIAGKTVCYPRVGETGLDLLLVPDPSALKTSRWKLREPDHAHENLVPLEKIDVLLVPGIAFSKHGGRLGRGGGFYDRLIAQPELRAFKIGICFDAQIVPELPVEAHDREVDQVITESGPLMRAARRRVR